MTVKEFVEMIDTADMRTGERYIDGSDRGDRTTFIIELTGHGELANAEVTGIFMTASQMQIRARGITGVPEYQKIWLKQKSKEWDELFARAERKENQ